MLYTLFALLILFQIKHYVCDFLLQNEYMLGKFKPGWDFVLPLLAHSAVHGVATLGICLSVAPNLWWLALVDVGTHFCIDRIKASPNLLGRFKVMSANEIEEAIWTTRKTAVHVVDDWGVPAEEIYKEAREAKKQIKHNVYYFWSLGLDQMLHHIVHYIIIFTLVANVWMV